jgi:catechol 2,3-dioxygenase-like lactoylglutathione lyase family enzyme
LLAPEPANGDSHAPRLQEHASRRPIGRELTEVEWQAVPSRLELTRYRTPATVSAGPGNPPPNTLGLHRVMFAVDDIDDAVARLRTHGAQLLGEVAQYEGIYRLCYLRGPAGIIVALAEQTG